MKKLKPQAVDWAQIDSFLARARIKNWPRPAKFSLLMKKLVSTSLRSNAQSSSRVHVQPRISREKSAWTSHRNHRFRAVAYRQETCGLLAVFDRLRRKRNIDLHDDTGYVSQHDAGRALQSAGDYLNVIRADIAARKP